ncbi:DUF6477 family protein [Roseinatronobacter sp. NSM]|uniref:DUF6477 family protein n=1 Tax=Roseinatronobacter sp. NSM TaxID=3457785 RepID=UPI004035B4BA
MKTLRNNLETTIRPRLLVVAARHATEDYCRDSVLPRVLGLPLASALPPPQQAIHQLTMLETDMEQARRYHDARWRVAEHVLVMAALMAETATLRAQQNGTIPLRAVQAC